MPIKNTQILIPLGILLIAMALLLEHFLELPDVLYGSLMGIGIGILIVPLMCKKIKPTR